MKVPSPKHALPYVAAVALAITAITGWLGWAWTRRSREETWREAHSRAKLAVWAKRYDLAEQVLLPILPQTEQWWPKGGQCLETLSLLGVAFRLDHKYDQAKPLLARGLELSKGMSSPDATVVGRLRFNLAIIDRDEGKDGEAEQFFSEALANFEKDPRCRRR